MGLNPSVKGAKWGFVKGWRFTQPPHLGGVNRYVTPVWLKMMHLPNPK